MLTRMIANFWEGFWAPLKSILLIIRSPSLFTLILIPLAINIGIYYLFFSYGAYWLTMFIQSVMASWSANIPPALNWIIPLTEWSMKILSWILLVLTSVITFTVVSSIVAAPFNDLLSKQTENVLAKIKGITLPETQNIPFMQSIKLEIKRTSILVVGGIIAFLIGIIPLMQIPALMIAAMLISFEYFGIPLSRRNHSLWKPAQFTITNFSTSIGLGFFLLLMMAIPMASIAYIPLSVISATTLFVSKYKNS